MKCPKCGGAIALQNDGNYVCLSCGAKFKKRAPSVPESTQQPEPEKDVENTSLSAAPAETEQPAESVVTEPQIADELKVEDLASSETVDPQSEPMTEQDEITFLKSRLSEMEKKQSELEGKVNKAYRMSLSNGALGAGKSGFTATVFNLFIEKIFMIWMSIVTLGIAYPWLKCHYESFLASNTYVCGRRRTFDGTGWELAKKYLLWLLLSYVTFGIYGLWLSNNVRKWVTEHTHYENEPAVGDSYYDGKILPLFILKVLGGIVGIFTLGIAKSFFICEREKYICEHTVIDGKNVVFDGNGMELLKKQVLWIALTVATCGIYGIWRGLLMEQWIASKVTSDDMIDTIVGDETGTGNGVDTEALRLEKQREAEERKRQAEERKLQREQEKAEKKAQRKELHKKPAYKAFAAMFSIATIMLAPAMAFSVLSYMDIDWSASQYKIYVALAIVFTVVMIALYVGCILCSKKLRHKAIAIVSIVMIACSFILTCGGFVGCSNISEYNSTVPCYFIDNGDGTLTAKSYLNGYECENNYNYVRAKLSEYDESHLIDTLEIPSEYNGKPVTIIDLGSWGTPVKKIIIPSSVKTILNVPSTIEEIVFEEGSQLTSIGSNAFYNCTGLTSITIPDSVTSIGYGAFSGCTRLTSITIPDSVTSIGDSAFRGCEGLTSITIPDSVTSIGDSAFENCTGLTSITIPDSVTSIGWNAFRGCTGLTSITIPFVGATKNGTSDTHLGYIFGASSYSSNSSCVPSSLKTVVITGGSSIGEYAFYGCTGLASITIPDSVTSIGYSAFYDCKGLTSITIPNSVTSIGSYAFYGCTGLTSVTIGNSVTSIGYSAFYDCKGLTSITIPDSVTSIGYSAFYDCKGLTSITIPDSVTSIGYSAFYDCKGLTSITIPDSVTSIGYSAFYDCKGLTSITIPDSVTSIGSYAFYGCTGLTSITIGSGVTSIGSYAFRGCTRLTSIIFEDTTTWYRTNSYSNWDNKTGGTQTGVTNSSTNATYFTDTYYDYYWYKK